MVVRGNARVAQKTSIRFPPNVVPCKCCREFGCEFADLRGNGSSDMTQFTIRALFAAAGFFLLLESQSTVRAQEAVSTTTSSESTSTSSTSGAGSMEPAPESSTSSTIAPPATAGSTGNAPTLERNPSGSGVFSPTPVQIYATLSGGYDDNVSNTSANKQSSAYTAGNVILDYTFGDSRLQIILNAGAGGTYYYSHISNQDYDIDLKGALGITYKASPRLTLGSSFLIDYLTEPSFQYAGGLSSRNGNYLYTTDRAFLEYAWSRRFSTRTSYTFEAYNYDNNSVGLFSDRVTNLFGNEFRLQLVPTTTLIAEYRYGIVSYQHEGDVVQPALAFGGIIIIPAVHLQLDSVTHYALVGVDHTFNPRLLATFRGGAQFRSYDNADRTGPYFEGNVTYAVGRRTSLSWINRYGLEEPDNPTEQSRTTFRTGVQTTFSMTSRTSAAVDLFYVHDDFHALPGVASSMSFTNDTFDGGLTLRYGVTGLLGVQAGYHYTNVSSDTGGGEYSRNRVFAGVNVTF